MTSLIWGNLYEIILEINISVWLESHGQKNKGQARFWSYHLIIDHLVTLRTIFMSVAIIK